MLKIRKFNASQEVFFAMQMYPDAIVVTVDDDVIYSRNLLESLYKFYRKF